MVVDRGTGSLADAFFGEISRYLMEGDLLVLNDTRVVPSRIEARKAGTGGRIELLFLDWSGHVWNALVKGYLRRGNALEVEGWPAPLRILDSRGGMARVESPNPEDPLAFFDRVGKTPLPPYIRRGESIPEQEREDRERYQTVYATEDGSVAAPTAGLHFSPALLAALEKVGVETVRVTLHVGWGTFSPLRGHWRDHRLHPEWGRLGSRTAWAVNGALARKRRVVAVGTTTVRLLESCWDTAAGAVVPHEGQVDLYITPGFRFRVVGAMLTNFHRPRSTLLLLVNAFAGPELMGKAYREAIRLRYRLFSFGDAMLIV